MPFFIADGIDDCAIAVEFRRFTVNERLLATCKAALALRRRGGESLEFPAAAAADQNQWTFNRIVSMNLIYFLFNLPLREFNALRFVPAVVRSGLAVSLAVFRKSPWLRDRCVRSVCVFFFCLLSIRSSSSDWLPPKHN